jgi:hypothetical protein
MIGISTDTRRVVGVRGADYSTSVTGVTALADGADHLFARAVLDGLPVRIIWPEGATCD